MPRVKLDWRLTPLDVSSLRRVPEILGVQFGRSGLGRLKVIIPADDAKLVASVGGDWHHMGTTRMHRDPKQGVVDADCRVHGIRNLFIAGSSVFPTGGHSVPTLTIVAMAVRLADHLKQTAA
jgi:choline dehydrogenase-like flavoprotein